MPSLPFFLSRTEEYVHNLLQNSLSVRLVLGPAITLVRPRCVRCRYTAAKNLSNSSSESLAPSSVSQTDLFLFARSEI